MKVKLGNIIADVSSNVGTVALNCFYAFSQGCFRTAGKVIRFPRFVSKRDVTRFLAFLESNFHSSVLLITLNLFSGANGNNPVKNSYKSCK